MRITLTIASLLVTSIAIGEPDRSIETTDVLESGSSNSVLESAVIETIVISATRTARHQFTTPASISLIENSDIALIQPFGFQDILESLPSVNIQGGPRRIAEEPAIRGFSDEQVAIRVDGTRMNFNKSHGGRFLLDPGMIKSIEVMRGAGSAIYGSGALGGAILIESLNGRDLANSGNDSGLRFNGGFHSNGLQWESGLTGYSSGDRLDALVNVTRRNVGEDLVDGNGNAILASRDKTDSELLKLGFEPNDVQRFELVLENFENAGRNPVNANEMATASNLVDRTTNRRNTRLRYELSPPEKSWLDLTVVAYENHVNTDEYRLDDARVDDTVFKTRGIELINTASFEGFTTESIRVTAGIEVFEDSQSGTRNGAPRSQFPDATVSYEAAFLQSEVPLPGGFSLIPGMRYDDFNFNDANATSRNESELTPRLALGWQVKDNLYLWAEYAQAFRAPSLGELYADGVHFTVPLAPGQVVINQFVPTPELRAEQSEQYQLGARWRHDNLLDRDVSMTLEATAWQSDVTDFVDQVVIFIAGQPTFNPQSNSLVFPGITTNNNVNARLRGAELTARLGNDIGYLNASLTLIEGEQANGENLASVQPHRASLGGGLYLLGQRLTVGADLLLSADRTDVPAGALETPGYAKTDLFLSYQTESGFFSPWEFRFSVDNVFDAEYRVHPNAVEQPGRSLRLAFSKNIGRF